MIKVCFVGLGSIGKRHCLNLLQILDNGEITLDALRSHKGGVIPKQIEENLHEVYFDMESMPSDYDIIFITNPTNMHYETIKGLVHHTKHMFIEKPVFQNPISDVSELMLKGDGIYYVAAPLRYNPVIQKLKEMIPQEKVYSVRVICSSYLPEWRKGIDYRDNYSAKKDMGGGVALDLIHEMDYITNLFGMPKEILYYGGTYSDLEIDSDDLGTYLLKYKDKIVELHLDYFGRTPRRELELFCKNYTIFADLIHNHLELQYSDYAQNIPVSEDHDYVDEMINFLEMVKGKTINDNDIEHANEVLKLALNRRKP